MLNNYVTEPQISIRPRDVQVFTFIEAYIKFHGFSPLLDEIAKEIGAPKQSIIRTINRLESLGCIKRTPRAQRSIIPIKSPISFQQ